MNLIATMPRKDAYKGQATHDHPCCALRNMVNQNFGERPRQVILTDITYLYTWANRNPVLFMHVHRRVYERSAGMGHVKKMDVELVRSAYAKMKEAHGSELDKAGVLIIQTKGASIRRRRSSRSCAMPLHSIRIKAGNSQDNAPTGVILWQAQDPYPLTDRIVRGTGKRQRNW